MDRETLVAAMQAVGVDTYWGDGSYVDLGTYDEDTGIRVVEAGDTDGGVAHLELTTNQLRQLHAALTLALMDDQR